MAFENTLNELLTKGGTDDDLPFRNDIVSAQIRALKTQFSELGVKVESMTKKDLNDMQEEFSAATTELATVING